MDAEAEFIGLLADMSDSESKEIGLMKSINGIQIMRRMGSAMKRVRMAAFEEEPEEKGSSTKEKTQEKPQKGAGSKSLR